MTQTTPRGLGAFPRLALSSRLAWFSRVPPLQISSSNIGYDNLGLQGHPRDLLNITTTKTSWKPLTQHGVKKATHLRWLSPSRPPHQEFGPRRHVRRMVQTRVPELSLVTRAARAAGHPRHQHLYNRQEKLPRSTFDKDRNRTHEGNQSLRFTTHKKYKESYSSKRGRTDSPRSPTSSITSLRVLLAAP